MILQQTIEQVIQEWPTLSTKESGSALVAKTLGEGAQGEPYHYA